MGTPEQLLDPYDPYDPVVAIRPDIQPDADIPILPKGRQLLDLIHVRASQGDPLALTLLQAHRASLTAEAPSLESHLHIQPHIRRGYAREARDVFMAQAFVALDDAPAPSPWKKYEILAGAIADMPAEPPPPGHPLEPLWKATQQGVGMPTTAQGVKNAVDPQLPQLPPDTPED